MLVATIATNKGNLEAQLYEKDAPRTVAHFVMLARSGFYDGLRFFKHYPDLLIQTGCPNNNGTGGPGYFTPCEVFGTQQHHEQGVLSMAHAYRNTNGSQFFICLSSFLPQQYDGNNTCFGKIISTNMDTLLKLRKNDTLLGINFRQVADPS